MEFLKFNIKFQKNFENRDFTVNKILQNKTFKK